MTTKTSTEQVEVEEAAPHPPPSINQLEKEKQLAADLEDDPHRAALEDNPDQPEKMTFLKAAAIFVRLFLLSIY